MQSYNTSQTNEKTTVNVIARRLSDKWDRESKRLTNGFIKLGLPGNKIKKGTPSSSSSSSSSSSPFTTSNTSTTSDTIESPKMPMNMQFQPSFNLPFVPPASKKDWNSSSIYGQIRQQQDMKFKIETLEKQLKHDRQVFEQEKTILLEEIKTKENKLHEKEQQWDARWSAKLHEFQRQIEQERKEHNNSILEWKSKYQMAMDTEQQKHYRRLVYFHERLTAKNAEYAELEQQLIYSTTSTSPRNEPTQFRSQRSASLGSGTISRRSDLSLSTATKRHSLGPLGLSAALSSDLYARELQDMTLRHQASVDNMAAEYEQDRTELVAHYEREKQVWKIEGDAQVRAARLELAQEYEIKMDEIHRSWQQKWDESMTQNKQDQDLQKQQWDQQLVLEKTEWESRQIVEQADLQKQLGWSKYELGLMLKEHRAAMLLAKQLNLVIDHTTDVEDMKYTLTGLLENGIKCASQADSLRGLSEKANTSLLSVGFMNLAIF